MTSKLKKFVVLTAIMLLLVVGLVACAPQFKGVTGGEPNANTESNNGFMVKQGKYYYFINGFASYEAIADDKANKFGNPIKGAIVRAEMNDDGTFTTPEVVVPKVVFNNNKEQGFSIFGNYIYYVTPSNAMSKDGTILTKFTEFCRIDINGKNNQVIDTFDGQDLKYKFTDKGLIVAESSTAIKVVPYDSKSIGKEKTIAETTTSTAFSVSDSYTVGTASAQDYVFFTKAAEDKFAKNNVLCAVDGAGNVIELANDTTFGDAKYQIALKNVAVEANGDVVIYYEKSKAIGASSENEGLFAYNLGSNAFTADTKLVPANEKRMTNKSGLTYSLLSYNDGVVVTDTANEIMYIPSIDANGIETKAKSWKLPKGFTPTITKFVKDGDNMYMYHQAGSRIERIKMLGEGTTAGQFLGTSVPIIAKDYASTWLAPEFIGNKIFFMHTTYLNYMHVVTLDESIIKEGAGLTATGVFKMNDADKKAYDKIIEDERKAEEDNN